MMMSTTFIKGNSQFVVNACEEHEVFAEGFKQVFHRDHRGAGGDKIVEYDDVALFNRRLVLAAQAFCER